MPSACGYRWALDTGALHLVHLDDIIYYTGRSTPRQRPIGDEDIAATGPMATRTSPLQKARGDGDIAAITQIGARTDASLGRGAIRPG